MNEPIDWAHRESLRQWSILAARGHAGARAVADYHGLVSPAQRRLARPFRKRHALLFLRPFRLRRQ
jgi:hypothetical protein